MIKKESKTTPHVNVKISAHDKAVELVTHDHKEVKPPQGEPTKRVHMSVWKCSSFFCICQKPFRTYEIDNSQ